jgi:hypothetical protein
MGMEPFMELSGSKASQFTPAVGKVPAAGACVFGVELWSTGHDRAERDRVHTDAAWTVVDRQRSRWALERSLRGRVRERATQRPLRLVRGHVHDRSRPAGGEELADRRGATGKRQPDVQRHQLEHPLAPGGVQRRIVEDGGVVHPEVDAVGNCSRCITVPAAAAAAY